MLIKMDSSSSHSWAILQDPHGLTDDGHGQKIFYLTDHVTDLFYILIDQVKGFKVDCEKDTLCRYG